MTRCRGSVDSIESMGLVDGPGIRTVVFLNGCRLRCLYCHNPEMWSLGEDNYTPEELVKKIIRNKPYFGKKGGVTFSGGEPLLQVDFLKECCKLLKKEKINIALDTAGVGLGNYKEILDLVDLVILDIKHIDRNGYRKLTGFDIDESEKFIHDLNDSGKPVWVRQVIVPGMMDTNEYISRLASYILKIKNVKKVEFLPFHHLGFSKYDKLNYLNPLEDVLEMDKNKCDLLYKNFMKKYRSLKRIL